MKARTSILALALALCASCLADAPVGASHGAAGAGDIGVTQQALTLNSQFTCINSDGGGALFRDVTGMSIARCYVMSQGFCDPNWWNCTYFGGSGVTAGCVHGSVTWRTLQCTSSGCNVQRCDAAGCVNKGTALYTTDGNTLMNGSNFDGFKTVTCQSINGGSFGHPILKRYTP